MFSGGGNLNVNGGTLTLSATNTYTGSTTATSGTLVVATNAPHNANGALGKATSDVTLGAAGGNLDATLLIAGPYTVGRPVRIATSNNSDTGARVLTLGGATPDNSTFSGNIFLGSANNAARGVYLTAAAGGTVTFSGVIQNPTGMDANEAAAAAAHPSLWLRPQLALGRPCGLANKLAELWRHAEVRHEAYPRRKPLI